MTEIPATPALSGPPAPARPPAADPAAVSAARPDAPEAPAEERGVAAADFETFLSLLTAQMRNQDPLQPMDSTEFVAQLASFSGVEQQIRANERLDAILDALSGGAGAGLASWIGLEAETAATLRHEGGPLALAVDPPAGADRAMLRVLDAEGRTVGAIPVDPAARRILWDGTLDGAPLGAGRRSFELAWFAGEAELGKAPARRTVRVADLRPGGEDGPRLGLVGGGEVRPEDLSALRPPEG